MSVHNADPDVFLEGGSRYLKFSRFRVKFLVAAIAQHQPVVGVKKGEPVVEGFDGFDQPLLRLQG